MRKIKYIIFIVLFATISAKNIRAELLVPLKDALDSAFPEATSVEKLTIILDNEKAKEIEDIAKIKLDSKIHIFYEFMNGSEAIGYGVVDTHILRTRSETILYLIDNNGKLINSEILAFFEPSDYMQPEQWLNLFDNKGLEDELRIGKKIPNITGATITAHEFSRNTRKILAIYKVAISKNNK